MFCWKMFLFSPGTHHGPTPMFGIPVGAIIPLTSCWIILRNKAKQAVSDRVFFPQYFQGVLSNFLTPLTWELPHVFLVVAVRRDDFSVAWHYIVAEMYFPFPVCFRPRGCPRQPFQLRSQSGHHRSTPPGQTARSRRGMWKSAGLESDAEEQEQHKNEVKRGNEWYTCWYCTFNSKWDVHISFESIW